jgi:hypothetical protein
MSPKFQNHDKTISPNHLPTLVLLALDTGATFTR